MYLIGYLSALSCRAGERVDVMVSSSVPAVDIDLVRLIHGDENPRGPGFVYEALSQCPARRISAREYDTPIGSYGISEAAMALGATLTLSLQVWPTTPTGHRHATGVGPTDDYTGLQGLMALPEAGVELLLDSQGRVALCRHGRRLAVGSKPLQARCWYQIEAQLSQSEVRFTVTRLHDASNYDSASSDSAGERLPGQSRVLLAACALVSHQGRTFARGHYNGKIAAPSLCVDDRISARWAFERDMSTQRAPDTAGNAPLRLINAPTRAMTGPSWSNQVHSWREDPTQYDAIHFHDDDLADACWPVAASIAVPSSLPSGVYAVRLRAEGLPDDYIPLAVRPAAGAAPAKIALVLATYTYLAYANEHLTEGDFEQGSEIPVETGEWEDLVALHQEWGKSHYDLHNDGSGVAYSSALRPIPNLRPTYRFWGFHAPRRFSADLYIVWFLHHIGASFDVLTEHDLHQEAATLLAPYQTVITGSHPEYYSGDMLDAYERHVARGGGLMYLGGDGFYWVTTPLADLPHVLEVRKSEGLRHWDADPGERYHASTGELGGIWRSRGRSAHRLFGIGMGAHGWDNKAPGYRRTPQSYAPEAAWVFEGIEEPVIGDFGLIMDGTSGDEIDRVDVRYGTPGNTLVLASSEPHSEWYVPVPEDVSTVSNRLNGRYNPQVRSDMVLVEHESGGAVFSVGSIIFTGALPINGGDNNVARLLANVVRNFTARRP